MTYVSVIYIICNFFSIISNVTYIRTNTLPSKSKQQVRHNTKQYGTVRSESPARRPWPAFFSKRRKIKLCYIYSNKTCRKLVCI